MPRDDRTGVRFLAAKLLGLAISVALLTGIGAGVGMASAETVVEMQVKTARVLRTDRGAERVKALPLPRLQRGVREDVYQVVYSLEVLDLRKGDVLQAVAEMEATNDCGYDVQFGSWIVLGRAASTTVPSESKREAYMAYPAGFNITNGNYMIPGAANRSFMHHGFVTRSSVYVVPTDLPGRSYVNVIGYALVDKFDCAKGGGLSVGQGYGHLSVLVLSSQ